MPDNGIRTKPRSRTPGAALWALLPAVALIATGCTMTHPGSPTSASSADINDKLMALPSLEETKSQLQGAVDEISTAATTIVPGIRFTDYHGESGMKCDGPYADTAARGRYLPDRAGEGAKISEEQWATIADVAKTAAAKVDATNVKVLKDSPGDHDVWFTGPGGSAIKLAYTVNLVISGYTGCRLLEADRVAGR
jgi:hypothetical protein